MSDKTYDALDAAIRDHIADEFPGAMVTGWALPVSYIYDDDGSDLDSVLKPLRQKGSTTIGILETGKHMMINEMLHGGDYDE